MWIYNMIDKVALLSCRINKNGFSFRKRLSEAKKSEFSEMNLHCFENKIIVTSGEFFPTSEKALTERLVQERANVLSQITSATDILICGKYPDWMLIEEAKKNGVKIIFVDKVGELFSRFATNLNKNRTILSNEEPLGV